MGSLLRSGALVSSDRMLTGSALIVGCAEPMSKLLLAFADVGAVMLWLSGVIFHWSREVIVLNFLSY